MKVRRLLVVAALLQLLAITAFGQKISVDHDQSVNFSKFKTYAWNKSLSTSAPNPLMDSRIIAAVDQQMADKGMIKVDAGNSPDLILVYHAAVSYETRLNTVGMGWGYGWGGDATTYVDKIPVGTLLVEMGDPNTRKTVWRGQGSDTVSDKPEKIEKKIYQVVEKMFKKFPPEVK